MMRAATRVHFLFIAGFGVLLAATSAARGEVLIGMASPLTGPMAWAGASNQLGAESAVADLNAKGGVLGERLEILAVDDFCDPDQALVAAEKLVAAGVPSSSVTTAPIRRFRPRKSMPRPAS
jgi:branched-chain amino acid transport system substrate-binding protein